MVISAQNSSTEPSASAFDDDTVVMSASDLLELIARDEALANMACSKLEGPRLVCAIVGSPCA